MLIVDGEKSGEATTTICEVSLSGDGKKKTRNTAKHTSVASAQRRSRMAE